MIKALLLCDYYTQIFALHKKRQIDVRGGV